MDSNSTTPPGSPAAKTPSRTPNRRALSADPLSASTKTTSYLGRSVHTPLDRSVSRDLRASMRRRTPGSARARSGQTPGGGPGPGNNSNAPPTPHAKAARRALDQRRTAMFTPGKNRRRSLMEQRETPLGILRNLGRALAPASKPIASSSSSVPSSSPRDRTLVGPIRASKKEDTDKGGYDSDDLDDDFPIDRPRLSLPIGEDDDDDDDDDDEDLRPPRLSQIGFGDDENYTVQSIELPRRAVSEKASRYSRGSLGSVRMSGYFDPDHDTDDIGQQSDFFPGLLQDLQARAASDDMSIERIDDAHLARRTTMLGRESDFDFDIPLDVGEQTTFVMSEPNEDAHPTSPLEEPAVAQGEEAPEAQEAARDAMYGSDDDDIPGFDDHSDPDDFADQAPDEATTTATATGQDLDPAQGYESDATIEDVTMSRVFSAEPRRKATKVPRKRTKMSQHGIEYPTLPPAFVKRVAQTALQSSGLSNSRISPDTLAALTQASDWFFEQLGDDLGAYASHAKRKTIEESDVVTLMRRQRQIGGSATMFSLAQRHLPRELLQELRMPVPQPVKQRRAKRPREDAAEEDAEEVG